MELRALSKALVTWAMFFVTYKRRLLHRYSPKVRYLTVESRTQVSDREISISDAHSSTTRQDSLPAHQMLQPALRRFSLAAGFSSHVQSLKTSGTAPGRTGPSPPPLYAP